jgi:hypothetical protein
VDEFLADTNVMVHFELDKKVWLQAAKTFSAHLERRRRSGGGSGNRLLGGSVIAGHALQLADRLMTFDASRHQRDFPTLHSFETKTCPRICTTDLHYCNPAPSDFR